VVNMSILVKLRKIILILSFLGLLEAVSF